MGLCMEWECGHVDLGGWEGWCVKGGSIGYGGRRAGQGVGCM